MNKNERIRKLRMLVDNHDLTREEYNKLVHGHVGPMTFSGCLVVMFVIGFAVFGIVNTVRYMISLKGANRQYQEAVSKSAIKGARDIILNEPYVYDSSGVQMGTNANYLVYNVVELEEMLASGVADVDTPLRDIRIDVSKMFRTQVTSTLRPIHFRLILRKDRYSDVLFFPLSSKWLYEQSLNEVTIPVNQILAVRCVPKLDECHATLSQEMEIPLLELICGAACETRFSWFAAFEALPYFVYNRYHPFKSLMVCMIICGCLILYRVLRRKNKRDFKEE